MKWWTSTLAASVVLATSAVPVAMAGTTTTSSSSAIVVNNDSLSSPHIIQQNGATYIPVWYIMRALKTVGVTSTWNGQTWNITTSSATSGLSNGGSANTGIQVTINGQTFAQIPATVAVDPASHHATTYVSVSDVVAMLNQLNLASAWTNGTLQVQTPDVTTLEQAFANTTAAPNSQLQGTLAEHLQLNLTAKGKTDMSGQPTSLDMQMTLAAQTGVVNGEKATYVTITPQVTGTGASTTSNATGNTSTTGGTTTNTASANATGAAAGSTSTAPQSIQEYIQGNRVYLNVGQGWTEEVNAEKAIQSLESQLPMQNVNFTALRNIQSSTSSDGATYTANLDGSSLEKMLQPILSTLTGTQSASALVPSGEINAIIEAILKQFHATVHITVQPIANQPIITAEQMSVDMNLPISSLPIPAASSNGLSADVSSMTMHETVSATYTYNNTPITPPTGLPTSSASSSSTTTAS